ncbi:MAG: thioredoxin domain-containing protein [Vicinamibacterales bacterium]
MSETLIRRTLLKAAGVVLLAVTACSTAAQPAGDGPVPETVVLTIGNDQFTLQEIDDVALQQQAGSFGGLTLEQALYESRRATIDQLIVRTLLTAEAEAQGTDAQTLAEQQITSKVVTPTEADIAAWYNANPQRVQGASLDQVADAISELLVEERTTQAEEAYITTLRAKTPVSITLEPPRTEVAHAGRPARGPEDAPIEIIEFSDFQCPFCLQAKSTVDRVLAAYGDRIRFVYRHYPLPNHPDAVPAAEASMCAAAQGQFWPYHDHLFANTDQLSPAALKEHATALGLDMDDFNACFDSREYRDEIEEDMAAAREIGVSGTPAFFINGRPLGGAQPFEAFQRIIEDELARN